MGKKTDYSRWLLGVDLAIVSIWAVCACWCIGPGSVAYTVVAPLIAMRLTMSYALYRREKNVLWLVGASIVIICLMFALLGADAVTILLAPMTKSVETVWRFFTHDNSMMHGAYQLLAHPGEVGIEGGGIWSTISIWALAAWVYLAPMIWSAILICTKRFEEAKWPWKSLVGYGVCYLLLCGGVVWLPKSCHPMIVWLFGSILLAIPFAWNRHPRVYKDVAESLVAILLLVIALLVGSVTPKWGSLIAMISCSALMIYVLCQRWDGAKWKQSYWLYAFVIPANVCFWSSQFVVDFWRYALVYLSFVLVIAAAVFYYMKKRKPIKTIAFGVCLGILIPFFSVGYNVLACTQAKRIGDFDRYPYTWRGMLMIEGKEGIGIRDRYGMVIAPFYEKIGYMGKNAPYVKIMREGLWNVTDLETHTTLFDCEFRTVEPVENGPSRREWALEYESKGTGHFILFIAPEHYSRFHPDAWSATP